MKNSQIDFSKHILISPIVADYIAGDNFIEAFYKYKPSIDSVPRVIADKSKEKIDRNLLVEVLNKQYSSLRKNQNVEKNISLLASEKTFTVTTGHQLNLFTGPLYFIYKILATVQLTRQCAIRFPDFNFVPVYWMASEDHDFEEINHIHLFGEKIEWSGEGAKNFGGPSGKLGTQGISVLLETVRKKIEKEEGSEKLIELLRNAYLKHESLVDATRYLVNELFGKYGLVVIDANEKRLKEKFTEVLKDDLVNHSSFNLVSETSKQLEKNYKVQVHPREINLFFMTDGSRERITGDAEKYLKELESSPENFSPNVVLRPLYQEMLLPDVAVIGGPAEIAYWLQYKKMFEHYKVNFPMLLLRKSFMFIDEKSYQTMKQLDMEVGNIYLPLDEIINKYIAHITWKTISLDEEKQQSENTFKALSEKVASIDSTLSASVNAEREKTFAGIEKLEAKLRKAEKIKHEVAIQKIKNLKQKLFPHEMLQERYENFIPFYLKYSDAFFETLLNNGDVFDFKLNVLLEEKQS
ncbi:MAG: bacillithiol biosynthesis cysteine-adding enzyme BshC [Bacteroidia bacterium]|nr:bacillithiol biosynthesis cysteine-adding enzyme BshC [Bacteroidia bacterium]